MGLFDLSSLGKDLFRVLSGRRIQLASIAFCYCCPSVSVDEISDHLIRYLEDKVDMDKVESIKISTVPTDIHIVHPKDVYNRVSGSIHLIIIIFLGNIISHFGKEIVKKPKEGTLTINVNIGTENTYLYLTSEPVIIPKKYEALEPGTPVLLLSTDEIISFFFKYIF